MFDVWTVTDVLLLAGGEAAPGESAVRDSQDAAATGRAVRLAGGTGGGAGGGSGGARGGGGGGGVTMKRSP